MPTAWDGREAESRDGTVKTLFHTQDGKQVEAVLNRVTIESERWAHTAWPGRASAMSSWWRRAS